uniref:Putative secreted protein n=1 Tax=Anopheles marajoara TaxID=58244 RepID=A0A2M4CFM8_9DIPT
MLLAFLFSFFSRSWVSVSVSFSHSKKRALRTLAPRAQGDGTRTQCSWGDDASFGILPPLPDALTRT